MLLWWKQLSDRLSITLLEKRRELCAFSFGLDRWRAWRMNFSSILRKCRHLPIKVPIARWAIRRASERGPPSRAPTTKSAGSALDISSADRISIEQPNSLFLLRLTQTTRQQANNAARIDLQVNRIARLC